MSDLYFVRQRAIYIVKIPIDVTVDGREEEFFIVQVGETEGNLQRRIKKYWHKCA